jgi:branched-chain amino acid transport system ATP-binding protein
VALIGRRLQPFEGLAPVIVDNLLMAVRRIRAETHMAIILVEQHARLILELLPDAAILDRGQVRWFGKSDDLLADPERLAGLIGL